MNIKTIKKTITDKLNDWLMSISDENLRIAVKKNILLSGGSITSMLLNEDVNDYDIYIKDKKVLKDLCIYYSKKLDVAILDGIDRDSLLDTLEDAYKKFLKATNQEEVQSAYAIAVRTLKPDQIKLFLNSSKGGLRVNENSTLEEDLNYIPKYFSPNCISLSNKIQLVCRFHGDNVAIHKTFDFIHATNYFTFDEGLVTNVKALESILTKNLSYQGSLYPLTSIIRMKKFIKRNWNINAGEILKIMFQISELNLKDPDVLEEQLIGVDVAYFDTLIQILRGVDKETISSKYLNTIIDKVFNEIE